MILVGIGGFFGALIRFSISKYIANTYPWATFLINCSGSFALGFLYGLQPIEWIWQLLGIGFLGAYTTFSTFGFEVLQLLEKHLWLHTVIYIVSSVILGILLRSTRPIHGIESNIYALILLHDEVII